jgi:tripartite-type tricarboxylate transporter receptor subunit TctC
MNSQCRARGFFRVLAALMLAIGLVSVGAVAFAADYPRRPVTMIVPWGAGGGTDAVARILGALLEQELGQPFNVVNRTGGSGAVGHSAIANGRPDGYTIGVVTVELTMMHWQGLTPVTYKDVTPVALVNDDPAGVMVAIDSKFTSTREILDYAKAHAGELKASGTGQGGIWHLALAGMLKAQGLGPNDIRWIPSAGAAPGLQDLIAGGVDVVTASIPEGKALIDAGRVKPLAVMSTQRNAVFLDVPTLKEAVGLDWTTAAWRGVAAPKGTPQAVVDVLEKALAKIVNGKAYKDFLAQRGYGWKWAEAKAFGQFMAEADASNGEVMKAAGLTR